MLSHLSEVTQLLTARATFASGLGKAPSAVLPTVLLEEKSLTRAMELSLSVRKIEPKPGSSTE